MRWILILYIIGTCYFFAMRSSERRRMRWDGMGVGGAVKKMMRLCQRTNESIARIFAILFFHCYGCSVINLNGGRWRSFSKTRDGRGVCLLRTDVPKLITSENKQLGHGIIWWVWKEMSWKDINNKGVAFGHLKKHEHQSFQASVGWTTLESKTLLKRLQLKCKIVFSSNQRNLALTIKEHQLSRNATLSLPAWCADQTNCDIPPPVIDKG